MADGELIDVTVSAGQCGFRYPVALTTAAWAACVAGLEDAQDQTEANRLLDLLMALRAAVLTSKGGQEVHFTVTVRNDHDADPQMVQLKSCVILGDQGEPVLTVMTPDED